MDLCCSGGQACAGENCIELTERESSVCRMICGSVQPLSFSELRSRSELHQEILSRIVRRLVAHGVVEKVGRGYRRVSQ